MTIINGIDRDFWVVIGKFGDNADSIFVKGLDISSVRISSIGTHEITNLFLTDKSDPMRVHPASGDVRLATDPDLINKEFLCPLCGLLIVQMRVHIGAVAHADQLCRWMLQTFTLPQSVGFDQIRMLH